MTKKNNRLLVITNISKQSEFVSLKKTGRTSSRVELLYLNSYNLHIPRAKKHPTHQRQL